MSVWDENLAHYDAGIEHCPRFERSGKAVPATRANGHMFSMLNKHGELGIRFGKAIQQQYIKQFGTGEFRSHGAVMQGYVRIPESVLKRPAALAKLLNEGYDHVMTLEPK